MPSTYLRSLNALKNKVHIRYSSTVPQFPPQPTRRLSILEDDDAIIDLSEDSEIVNGARPNTPLPHLRRPPKKPTPQEWKVHRERIRKEFPQGWAPTRKLSRDAMEGLRQLNRLDQEKFSTPVLAERFRISPEAVRRVLKSKWEPSPEKKRKLLSKEQKMKEERLTLSRLKEMMEARQVASLNKNMMKPRSARSFQRENSSSGDSGHLSEDRLAFE